MSYANHCFCVHCVYCYLVFRSQGPEALQPELELSVWHVVRLRVNGPLDLPLSTPLVWTDIESTRRPVGGIMTVQWRSPPRYTLCQLDQDQSPVANDYNIGTSAKVVIFYPAFVCMFVGVSNFMYNYRLDRHENFIEHCIFAQYTVKF